MQILAPTLTRDFFTPPTCTVSSRKGLGLAGNIQTSALDQLQGYAGAGCTCRYQRLVRQNATSLARRFKNLRGLQLLLQGELAAIRKAQTESLEGLQQLTAECSQPSEQLVEEVRMQGARELV